MYYPPNVMYDCRCWSEGNYMPDSQFCSVPYRPAVAGPFVRGARQSPKALFGNPYPCPVMVPGPLMPPCTAVSQYATACASGTVAQGHCQ
jgi:hypothetical protein